MWRLSFDTEDDWEQDVPNAQAALTAARVPEMLAVIAAAQKQAETANDLINEAYTQSLDPNCAEYMCDRDEYGAALAAWKSA